MLVDRVNIIKTPQSNVRSVYNAFNYFSVDVKLCHAADDIFSCDLLVLPGNGSFPSVISWLNENGFSKKIKDYILGGGYFLGICVGMQVLFEYGLEGDRTGGLGIIEGGVDHMSTLTRSSPMKYNFPNIGWFSNDLSDCMYYYQHSYMVFPTDDKHVISYYNFYDWKVPSIVKKYNALGFQFHPEKSGEAGLCEIHNILKGKYVSNP